MRPLLFHPLRNRLKPFDFNGGRIDYGIVREIKEETGLTILNPRLCGVKQFPIEDGRYIVFLFRADKYEGELISSEEGDMHWIKKKNYQV